MEVRKLTEKNAEQYYEHACKLYGKKEYDKALRYLNIALEKDEKLVMALYLKGLIYRKKHMLVHATRAFKDALSMNKNFPDLYTQLGEIYEHQENYTLARICLEQAARTNPKDPDLHYRLAEFYLEHCPTLCFNLAIGELSYIIEELDNTYIKAYLKRSEAYCWAGKRGSAINDLYIALERNPDEDTKDICRNKIISILNNYVFEDSFIFNPLPDIKTYTLFEAIKKLPKENQEFFLMECLEEGTVLYTRMEMGDGYLEKGFNMVFQNDIFADITKYLVTVLKTDINNYKQQQEKRKDYMELK